SVAPDQQLGSAVYLGRDDGGRAVRVRVLGRDAQDTQRMARRWRLLAYRDPPRSAPIGRLEQVEHEALALFMAAQAGVRVPDAVAAAAGRRGDALLVPRQPDVEPLERAAPEDVDDATLTELWRQVDRLHAAGIAHGRLNLSNVVVAEDGPMLINLAAATLGATRSEIDIDVAEILVACTVLVGPDRAWRRAVDSGWSAVVGGILPYLQRAALTPHLRDLARGSDLGLKQLREGVAEKTGQPEPELVPLRRFSLKELVLTFAL